MATASATPTAELDALPTSFFVDRNGKVVAAQLGLTSKDDIEANIRRRWQQGSEAPRTQSDSIPESHVGAGYLNQIKIGCCAAAMLLVSFATIPPAQSDDPGRSILKGAAVEYLYPEQVTMPAGKPSPVVMHFRVGDGLHINSHTPSQDFPHPHHASIPEASGVRLEAANYPAGSDIHAAPRPGTKLSVYTGEFTIKARIVATRGNHLVEAKLHYQACDKNACMPPKPSPSPST